MSVWNCPHCRSVQIITGEISDYKCNKLNCGAILDRLDEPDAGRAMREAFYGFEHGFAPALGAQLEGLQSVNTGQERLAKALNADEPGEIGDAP